MCRSGHVVKLQADTERFVCSRQRATAADVSVMYRLRGASVAGNVLWATGVFFEQHARSALESSKFFFLLVF